MERGGGRRGDPGAGVGSGFVVLECLPEQLVDRDLDSAVGHRADDRVLGVQRRRGAGGPRVAVGDRHDGGNG
ncbi:hypothetical protein A4U61_06060 [Streptomyces sp. H-KF8]|nr:hypothetical protein A4U61_06060 [Streptomyces sp. H-KF8]